MPRKTFMGSLSSPKVDVFVDLGNPLLNHTLDGFLKIGTVGVAKVAMEETYHVVKRGSVSKHNFETSLKKMCKEGAYWGTVAGVYVGMEYGVERVRGTRDWVILCYFYLDAAHIFYLKAHRHTEKNAMIGGALTGALVSSASSNKGDKIVMDAITGGAIATAAEFISYLT